MPSSVRNYSGKKQIVLLYFLNHKLRFCLCVLCLVFADGWSEPPSENFFGDGFSLPGGGALGCASGRLGLGTAAHMTCQRQRQGPWRRRGVVLLLGKTGGKKKRELKKTNSASFYTFFLNATRQYGNV